MIFGIDFGTTSSSICYFNNIKKKYTLLKKNNRFKIPSIIYQSNNKFFIKKSSNFEKISHFKRQINYINFTDGSNQKLEEYLKFYLNYLHEIIKTNFNEKINGVFTVPTSFNHYQRSWYKNLLENIGFNVTRIISEPSSAVISFYHFNKKIPQKNKVLVIDLGGGTTDISLLEKDEEFYQVIYNKGDLYLGGEDFTKEISQNLNISNLDAEKRKLKNNIDDTIYYQNTLTKFQNLIFALKNDIRDELNNIEDVILVGNGLKLIGVLEFLKKEFPDKVRTCKEQEYLVAYGAGILANKINDPSSELVIVDSTSLSLGIETADMNFSIIIPSNSPLPASGIRKYLPSDDNEDEITLTIYQGEHSLAQDNEIVGEIIIPANPRKYIDSIYQVNLKLDLNGIIHVKIKDLSDKDYYYDKILKFNKSNNINYLSNIKNDNNEREIRRLKYEIKFTIQQISLGLDETKLSNEDKNSILTELNLLLDNCIDYPTCLKNKELIFKNYGHLQYSKNDIGIEDDNDFKKLFEKNKKEDNNYSDNLLNNYLKEKLKNYLDLEKVINSENLLNIVSDFIENYDNYELMEIKNKINDIDEVLNNTSDYQEYKNLILEIEYELESNNLDITLKQQELLRERINYEKTFVDFEDTKINYFEKINDFNKFCENII